MAFTGSEDHSISLKDAAAMTKAYRDAQLNNAKGCFFGKDAIASIIAQSGCVGIRIYFALDPISGLLTAVLVGANANEDDLDNGVLAERAIPCPMRCGISNTLNS